MQNLRQSSALLFQDRIAWMALLIVLCFIAVLLLESQSRASYPTYALALLMLATVPKWIDVVKIPLMLWVGCLVIWLSLSTIWSTPVEWRASVSIWVRALLIITFVVAMAECQLRGQLQRWMGLALTAAGAVAVIAAFTNFFLTDPEDGRLNGLGQLDTHVIAALVYGVVLLFTLRVISTNPNRALQILVLGASVCICAAVVLSDSRNAWVSVLLGVSTYVLAKRTHDVRQFATALAALAIILICVVIILLSNETTRELLLPRGDSFRLTIWNTTWGNIIADNGVLFGRGITTNDDLQVGSVLFQHPHSIYLALIHQGGLIALALYLCVLAKTSHIFLQNFEAEDAKLGISILMIAVSAHVLDGHEMIDKVGDTWFLVWMPIGLAVGLCWTPRPK